GLPRTPDDAGGRSAPGRSVAERRSSHDSMTRTRAVIVEDEALALQTLRELLAGVEWVDCVGEATSGPAAQALIERERPALVFLDIQLPEFDGLELLRRLTYQPAVIFTTAYDRYAVSAFE